MQSYFSNIHINHLQKRDFQTFYRTFKEVIEESIPSFKRLFFFHSAESVIECEDVAIEEKKLQNIFTSKKQKQNLYCCLQGSILLTIPTFDGTTLAVLSGVDSYFAKKVADDWLENFGHNLLKRYLSIKQAGTSLETGFLNCQKLFIDLKNLSSSSGPSVILLEAYPLVRSAIDARNHTSKVVNSLKNNLNGKFPVYYLGHGVFAVLDNTLEKNVFLSLGKSLVSWLRRDGIRRIHVGLRYKSETPNTDKIQASCHLPVDEAWSALQEARKRGPFSLFDFDQLSHPEKHPLHRPSKSLLAKFRRKWRYSETFSVVQFQPAKKANINHFKKQFPGGDIIFNGEDLYLLLHGKEPQQALNMSLDYLERINSSDVLVAVAYYPHNKFAKSTTVLNCRKALHHATLLGKNGAVVFDSVSLNVSGDIFFAEGDLASAIKEYKCGLELNPSDINLLNSLGVAYADLGKTKDAHICFKKVLAIDSLNFMALFNLGLGEELLGRTSEALDYFEKAYENSAEAGDEVKDDLQFQLGKLCCICGEYTRSIKFLTAWYAINKTKKRKGRALTFLGKSYFGKNMLEEATTWLQRALRHDEFDSDSMGLLGLIYLLRKEGDEIALSLCSKSIELNPDNILLKLYLAKTQIACKQFKDAKENLKQCLRNRITRVESQLLFCICYREEGLINRAKYWLNRVLENNQVEPGISSQADKIGEELNAI